MNPLEYPKFILHRYIGQDPDEKESAKCLRDQP